jgi:4-nitrophenyl phosphatase
MERAREARYSKLIFDLDGTLYRGRSALPSAVEVINTLMDWAELLFLSNNGGQTAQSLTQRLCALGFNANERDVISSVTLAVEYISSLQKRAPVFVINSGELRRTLEAAGHRIVSAQEAEFLVVGVDFDLTYNTLDRGLLALRNGARLIAMNADPVYPVKEGFLPAAGAFVGAFRGMGYAPDYYCGKPDRRAMEKALALRGMKIGPDCLVIGDHLETDIRGARNIGVDSVLVLTGVSTQHDIEERGVHPTYVIDDLSELRQILDNRPTG